MPNSYRSLFLPIQAIYNNYEKPYLFPDLLELYKNYWGWRIGVVNALVKDTTFKSKHAQDYELERRMHALYNRYLDRYDTYHEHYILGIEERAKRKKLTISFNLTESQERVEAFRELMGDFITRLVP